MSLHFLDAKTTIRRNTYSGDKSTLATVFTNIDSSVQQDDVEIGIGGGGYASRTFTVFMGTEHTIKPEDRIITTDGKELRVSGVKLVTSGSEDYQQIACYEAQD